MKAAELHERYRSLTEREPGAPNRRFDAGGDNKRQRALIADVTRLVWIERKRFHG